MSTSVQLLTADYIKEKLVTLFSWAWKITAMRFSLGVLRTGSLLNSLRYSSVVIKVSCVLGLSCLFMSVVYYKAVTRIMEIQNVTDMTFSNTL